MTPPYDAPQPGTPGLHALAQAYQDNLISLRQPSWMKRLTAMQLDELNRAMKTSLKGRRLVSARLRQIQRIEYFTVPLMQEALRAYDPNFDVRSMKFDQGVFKPVSSWAANRAPIHEVEYKTIPLMEAVLWNFTAQEATEGGQRQGNCLVDAQGRAVNKPSAVEFARLCRELDLGARYQAHLSEVLYTSWSDSGQQVTVSALLEASLKADMLMEAYKARYHDNTLSDAELHLIVELCRSGDLGTLAGNEVKARQLQLLGCLLEQIVVLDVMEDGLLFGKSRKRVLVYIPGDPHGPWSAFDSLEDFVRKVPGKRLRQHAYRDFFKRFVPLGERAAFFAQVIALLGDITDWATRDLEEHVQDYPRPLFAYLAAAHSLKVLGDAAVVLSPVAQLDRRLSDAHHQRLASDGGLLLGLASFFVPEIALALLAVLAWEMLCEVFEGIEAWYDGDTHEAVDHFIDVGKRAAEIAAMAAGGKRVARLLPGAKAIDSLVPTRLEDGRDKLWTMDLGPFRSAPPPAGVRMEVQGIHRLRNEHWVEMEGQYYPVRRTDDRQWQLQPRNGHAPRLSGSAAGTWRLQCDDPATWSDTHRMLRRLGEPYRTLSDDQIDSVLAIHNLQADPLRDLHVRGDAAPPVLFDTVVRVQLVARVVELGNRLRLGVPVSDTAALDMARALPGAGGLSEAALANVVRRQRRQLVGQLYQAWSTRASVTGDSLMRMFPGLHRPAVQALLRMANAGDRQRFLATGRVPLSLAEAARSMSLQVRAIRVHEAFVMDTPQTSDLARVALGMLPSIADAPELHWRLLESRIDGPVLFDNHGAGESFDMVHLEGQFRLYQGGLPRGAFGELFTVMTSALAPHQRFAAALGEPFPSRLQTRLGLEAGQRRRQVERLLSPASHGALAALQRLDERRVGFPLSGRGAMRAMGPSALYLEVRRIYPHFDVDEITEWLAGLERKHLNVWEELPRLRQKLVSLEETLHRWHVENLQDADNRVARGQIKERLIAAWRQMPNEGGGIDRVVLSGLQPGRLPELPAGIRFPKVTLLDFRGMGLPRVPPGFIGAFPNLTTLHLPGNRLTRLPNQLALRKLNVLNLHDNQITLDATQATVLASCESLECIDLTHNPLGRSFSVSGMRRLRTLRLNNTQIDTVPNGLEDCSQLELADLRNNRLTRLPQELVSLPSWTGRTIRLEGNPLDPVQLASLHAASEEEEEASTVAPERWATASPDNVRKLLVQYWTQLEAYDRSTGVMLLLRQLQQSAAFRRQPRVLAHRVYRMLQRMQANERLREELFEHVDDGLTCQDGHLWRFSMLEVRMKAWSVAEEAGAGDVQAALLRFGRRQWRLYMVEELVKQRIPVWLQSSRNVDPLEVVMGYQLALREHLELPIEADEMAYPDDARLDARRVGRIRDEVLALESQAGLAEWLIDQPFWSEFMDKAYQQQFSQLDDSFHQQLTALTESPQAGGRASLEAIMEDIQSARQSAKRKRMIELTIAAMDIPPGGREIML